MRISTSVDYAGDPVASANRVKALEAAGIDMVWIAEAYSFDAVSLLGYLAAVTERIELGSGILNTYSRTPACLAQTAAGLDAVSGGRFTLGLGASGPQVIEGFHGMPYDKPLTRWKEIVDICRMAWRREKLEYQGDVFTLPLPAGQGSGLGKPLKLINHPVRSEIPVFIAALQPRSVTATAAVADGWIPFLYAPTLADRVWGDALRKGLAQRPAELGPLDIVGGGIVAMGPDAEKYRDMLRPMAALYIGGMGAKGKNFYNDVCRGYGFEEAAETVQDLYLSGKKDEAAAALPAELLEACTICGDEGYVRERLAAFAEAGVRTLNVTPVGGDPVEILARLRELAA